MIDAPDKEAGDDANRTRRSLLQSKLRYLSQKYWGMNLP
jgi:hypothetical protein